MGNRGQQLPDAQRRVPPRARPDAILSLKNHAGACRAEHDVLCYVAQRSMLAGEADLLKSVFLKLTVQGGQAYIQRPGGGLAITSSVLQCLHNRLALNLSQGSVTG
jgi:hypothetical protein